MSGTVQSVRMSINSRVVSNSKSGSEQVTGQGRKNIRLQIETEDRVSYSISVEGRVVRSGNNYTSQNVKTGNEPCAQYEIPDARSTCKSGYRKTSSSITQYRHATNERRGGSSVWRTYYSSWRTASSPPAELTRPSGALYWRYLRLESRSITVYYCTPESNCQGDPIYETVDGNSGDLSITDSFDVEETDQERRDREAADARREAERLAEEERKRQEEQDRVAEEERQDIVSDIEDRIYGLPDIPENPEDTKYRVISPESYSIQNGRRVPNIRYESIRFLSPENVANFVARGYEVTPVANDIPLSPSKPYGRSIIARNTALRPETEAVCTNCNQGRGRLTITQVANQQKNYNFTRRDSIVSRTSKRRVTR